MRIFALTACFLAAAAYAAPRPAGLYAEIRASKGLIVARLEMDLTPMTVANFVGVAEGTIANAAFDPGRPFFDGSVYHRVVPGHVIQTGAPQSERARNPGYAFPNEIHAKLSHNHAGAINMANAGPGTNASQWCITLGDRSYLDGDYTVFGEVVEGMDVVMKIVQGDVVESVRIVRVGAKAEAFHPTTESFRAMVKAAEQRVAEHAEKKAAAEREWLARNRPQATVIAEAPAPAAGAALRVRYRGQALRYVGAVIGRTGPPLEPGAFVSSSTGTPARPGEPEVFPFEPGKTKINAGLDATIAAMKPGERRTVAIPPALAYGRSGFYTPEVKGQQRFVISPATMLVYDIEVLP